MNNFLFRWFRCHKEGLAVITLWPVPRVCQPQSSWAVDGALECVCGRATAKVTGKMIPAHLGLQGWALLFNPGKFPLTYISYRWYWSFSLLQFFPMTAPPDGQTELTLCGWEFQSPLRPSITSRTHQVRLGQTTCSVIPLKSNNTQWVMSSIGACLHFSFSCWTSTKYSKIIKYNVFNKLFYWSVSRRYNEVQWADFNNKIYRAVQPVIQNSAFDIKWCNFWMTSLKQEADRKTDLFHTSYMCIHYLCNILLLRPSSAT